MQNSFLFQLLNGLTRPETAAFRKFLHSPFHNHRADVRRLYAWWLREKQRPDPNFDKTRAFEAVYPGATYDADQLNLCLHYLLELAEAFLAYQEWQADPLQPRLSLLQALRRRELGAAFERQATRLETQLRRRPERHAGFYLLEYQLQKEIFEHHVLAQRDWQHNLPGIVTALDHFFALEHLRWSGMTAARRARSGAGLPESPLAQAVYAYAAAPNSAPALVLQYHAARVMAEPDNEAAFEALATRLPESTHLFPASQGRDLYMTAINFCIRRQNKGNRTYTRRAFDLYRQALDAGILLENGAMPPYTYHNINALAHLAGEGGWARQFLEQYKNLLPPTLRENTYHYNLAICYFRTGDYARTLDALRIVDSSEVFVQLDIRRMLARAYFELEEWLALDSLLGSFKAYLQRKKELGYHRESYLNFIKFTHQLVNTHRAGPAKRQALALKIQNTQQVAEREWLLGKVKKP